MLGARVQEARAKLINLAHSLLFVMRWAPIHLRERGEKWASARRFVVGAAERMAVRMAIVAVDC